MRVLTGRRPRFHAPSRAVVTVGVFDGVHHAHQRLVRSTVRLARRMRGTSVVVTFDPDPQAVLDPEHAPPALMPLEARLARLRELGIDGVWIIPFTKPFARIQANAFVHQLLIGRLHAAALIVGETFAFGRGRRGNMRLLRRVGPVAGMRIVSVKEVRSGGAPISSSRIRRLIAEGRLAAARRLLGRPPELYGTVVTGAGRARRLGFPTANIRLRASTLPPRGVYAVRLRLGARAPIPGVMNLGVRPTFGPGPLVCEVHLLGFSGRLTGRSVSVSLLGRLRGERCFPSSQALVRQVRRDIQRARRLFSRSR